MNCIVEIFDTGEEYLGGGSIIMVQCDELPELDCTTPKEMLYEEMASITRVLKSSGIDVMFEIKEV